MMESVTYRAIFEEGWAEGWARGERKAARKILLLLGRDQLGEPSAGVQATLDAIADVDQLEHLIVQLKHATRWEELLGMS
jgi:hypothetical protein